MSMNDTVYYSETERVYCRCSQRQLHNYSKNRRNYSLKMEEAFQLTLDLHWVHMIIEWLKERGTERKPTCIKFDQVNEFVWIF